MNLIKSSVLIALFWRPYSRMIDRSDCEASGRVVDIICMNYLVISVAVITPIGSLKGVSLAVKEFIIEVNVLPASAG
jgi:hypothetical protein